KQQATSNKQQATSNKQQATNLKFTFLLTIIALLFLNTSLTAQIKVWPNSSVSIANNTLQPNSDFMDIWRNVYIGPTNATSGCSFTNYSTSPILEPQWGSTMWVGSQAMPMYRVYGTKVYQYIGNGVWSTSDSRLKKNITRWNESALTKLSLIRTYRYDMDPEKLENVPQERMELLTKEGENQIGFLAQELIKVFPEMVDTPEDGYMAVNYGMLIPVLLEAIKEQQALILELQEKVAKLEK
ncbi:MAG: tail fiber domain-containing protein, partial [Salibacteraceae bacterium]